MKRTVFLPGVELLESRLAPALVEFVGSGGIGSLVSLTVPQQPPVQDQATVPATGFDAFVIPTVPPGSGFTPRQLTGVSKTTPDVPKSLTAVSTYFNVWKDENARFFPNAPLITLDLQSGFSLQSGVPAASGAFTAGTVGAGGYGSEISVRITPEDGEKVGDPITLILQSSFTNLSYGYEVGAQGVGDPGLSMSYSAGYSINGQSATLLSGTHHPPGGSDSQSGPGVARIATTIGATFGISMFASGGGASAGSVGPGLIGELYFGIAFAPDIKATQIDWNTFRGAGNSPPERGIDVSYDVLYSKLSEEPEVAFYWSDTSEKTAGARLERIPAGKLGEAVTNLPTARGPFQFNEPARWDAAPAWARYILAEFDPDNKIREADETNNVVSKRIHTEAEILAGAVVPTKPNAITIDATFVPGRNNPDGPLTLSEAEVVLGVDHFNWQQKAHGPGNWEFQVWRHVPTDASGLPLVDANGRPSSGDLIATTREINDPIVRADASDTYFVRVDGLFGVGDVRYFVVPIPSDSFPFYLDEDDAQFGLTAEWQTLGVPGGTVSATQFKFSDAPKVADWAYDGQNNHYLTFTTSLVGVGYGSSRSVIPLNSPEATFTWKSNTIFDGTGTVVGGGVRYRGQFYPDPTLTAAASGGGVFDVRYANGARVPGFAGVDVTPLAARTTTEGGGRTTLNVVLTAPPAADVTVRLSSSDTTEGIVSPASVTFTAANWNVPQTVTVTGVDDADRDGDIAYTINVGPITSADALYAAIDPDDVAVTNADNDVPDAPAPVPTQAPAKQLFAVGAGVGVSAHVKVYDALTGEERLSFYAYENTQSGVRVGTGDVTGDGYADIITGTTAGPAGGHVRVFDGRTGALVHSFLSLPGFTGGIYVAIGDVNGDGFGDMIVGADNGDLDGDGVTDMPNMIPQFAGGRILVFDGRTAALLRDFRAFDLPFLGGVRVAAGDFDRDGAADIVAGSGFGSTPHVKVFSGAGNTEIRSFFAYAAGFRGGVFVGAADLDGDGLADLVTEAGGIPHVKGFVAANPQREQVSFIATSPDGSPLRGGPLSAADRNGDGVSDLLLAATGADTSMLWLVDPLSQSRLSSVLPFPGFRGQISVG